MLCLQGVALTKVPKIKFLIIIGGAKFKSPAVADDAYASPIQCPSLHFLGNFYFFLFGQSSKRTKKMRFYIDDVFQSTIQSGLCM